MIHDISPARMVESSWRDAGGTPVLRDAVAALPAYVAGRRSQSPLIAALASNESHFPPLPSVLDAVRSAAGTLNRYPDPASLELRETIANKHDVDVARVVVGAGSCALIQQIITSLCDPDDEVIFAWRSFEAYPILTRIIGARAVAVPLRGAGEHDLPAMAAAVTDRTRLIILCSPNNPTGVAISRAALEDFLGRVPTRVLVLVDEAYIEYSTNFDITESLTLYRRTANLCVVRTFSKAHGLAGLRIGYAFAHETLADGLRSVAVPFAVSTIAQRCALASIAATAEMHDRVSTVTAERSRICDAARGLGWPVPQSQANFIWLPVTGELHATLVDAFNAAGILVRAFPDAGVRVTLADKESNDRVLGVLKNHG